MRQQSLSSRLTYDRPILLSDITSRIADRAQTNTQQYGRRPYGVGLLIGSLISGPIVDAFLAADGTHDWRTVWLIPAALAVGVALFFAALFRERETAEAAEVPQGV